METLAERDAEVRALRVELVEARAAGKATGELECRLQLVAEKHAMILDIVEKEKTIKQLWHPATPAYQRAVTQVSQLAAQLEMLGGT
jgi:hypothetical protein